MMKKLITISITYLLLFLFPLRSVNGGVGIKGGVCLSGLLTATGDFRHFLGYEIDWLSMGNLVGFQIGVFHAIDISKRFKIQPEVYLTVRGGDASEEFLFDTITYKVKLSYVEVPVLLKYEIPLKGRFRPVLLLGPYGALKLSAKKDTEIWGRSDSADLSNVTRFDYGAVFGTGLELDLGTGRLILELRYNLGLKNIMTIPKGVVRLYEDRDSVRNFAFVVMTGYRF